MPPDLTRIDHLVILMMENRSFDHYLGSLSLLEGRQDIDGLPAPPALPGVGGTTVTGRNLDGTFSGYAAPPHDWDSQHASYNGGLNNGFVQQYQAAFPLGQSQGNSPIPAPADIPVSYYTRATLPVLYALADRFNVCDRWFGSVLSSTWPNRKYLISGRRDADRDTQTLPPFPGFATTPFLDAIEKTVGANGRCTWRCYFSDLPFLAFWYEFAAAHALSNFKSVETFVEDCRANALPTVSLIDPPFSLADDHPSHDVRLGQKFVGLIVDALTNSASWQSTALVLLYDENGGFYDHVAPPRSFEVEHGVSPAEDDPLGLRVPAIVISAYPIRTSDKPTAVRTTFDHTSIIRSINARWNVPFPTGIFGPRWQLAPDIWTHCFDFSQEPLPPGTYTQPAADIAAGVRPPFADLDWRTGIRELLTTPAGILEGLLERVFVLPELKALDRRAQVFDSLRALEQSVRG